MNNLPSYEEFLSESVSPEATQLADQVGEAIRSVFPGAFVRSVVKTVLTTSVYVDFTLGSGKDDWANGIHHNDPAHHSIYIRLNDDGTVPNRVKVELIAGGGLMVKPAEGSYLAFDRLKTGWRDFSAPPAEVPRKIAAYFAKMKEVLRANLDRLKGEKSVALAKQRLSESVIDEAGQDPIQAVSATFKKFGYSPLEFREEPDTESLGRPSVIVVMHKLSEDGPTKGSGEINYRTVSKMEVDLRDRLGTRNSPRFGQYTREMGYKEVPEGKLMIQIDLL